MAEPAQQVVTVLGDQLLPQLGAAPRDPQPALDRPADQSPVEAEGLPWPARRWKLDVRRSVATVLGDRFHPAANSHPHRRGGHRASNGRSDANPCRHRELERGAVAAARGDPDPAAERPLDDEPQRYRPSPRPPWDRLRPAGPVFSKRVSTLAIGRPCPWSVTVISSHPRWTW